MRYEYYETPVNDIQTNESGTTLSHNVVTVSVGEDDDLLDLVAEDGDHTATLRLTLEETLALIASLTAAAGHALANR